jgi:hypothetical protein
MSLEVPPTLFLAEASKTPEFAFPTQICKKLVVPSLMAKSNFVFKITLHPIIAPRPYMSLALKSAL